MMPSFPDSDLRSSHKVSMASTSRSSSKEAQNLRKPFSPQRKVPNQVTHSMPQEKREIFTWLHDWAENNILVLLKEVEKSWQSSDYLPDSASEGFEDQVRELRERNREIPDDCFVALVGNMITEEALPTYLTFLNTLGGIRDETGASPTPWAIWIRGSPSVGKGIGLQEMLVKSAFLSGKTVLARACFVLLSEILQGLM